MSSCRGLGRQYTCVYTSCTQFASFLCKRFCRLVVCSLILFYSNHRSWSSLVFVAEYELASRDARSANIGTSGRGDGEVRALENGPIHVSSGDATCATHREEAKDIDAVPCWTL